MSDWVYSEVVKDHFMNPRNILTDEDVNSFDGKGTVGNIKCGDEMIVVIKVGENKTISECKWKTYGCASAIASTSMLSEAVIGMKIEDAYHLSPKDIAKKLGGLPEHKIHCSVLGDKALRAAIDDYYKRNNMTEKIEKEEAKIVCQCMNVTDHEIEEAILEGARSFIEVQERTKASTVCGQCKDDILKLIDQYTNKHFNKT